MCLVAVYLQGSNESLTKEPVLTDIAQLEARDGEVLVRELFGQPHTLRGSVRSIDFLENTVVVETSEDEAGIGG